MINTKGEKIRRGVCGCTIWKNLALGSEAYKQEKLKERRRSEFWAYAWLQVIKH
jgi:hypothetical protein